MSSEVSFGDVADLSGGYAFKSSDYRKEGVFVLRTVNIKDDGSITRHGAVYVSEKDAARYERFYLKPFDTLFVMVGATLGKTGLVQKNDLPALLNQNMWVIRTKDPSQLDPLYLYYKYSIESSKILKYSTGAARDFVRRDDFRNIKFKLPNINEQREITEILSSLDEKIELNRKMNKTLEEIGQALFKHWFVDNPEKENWKIGNLGEIIENSDSRRVPLSSRERSVRKGLYPYYGATSVMDHIDDYLFDGEYLLLAEDGTVLTDEGTGVLQYVWGKFWVNNHAHVLRAKSPYNLAFLYFLLRQTKIDHLISGAVQLKLNQGSMNSLVLRLPPKDILASFQGNSEQILASIRTNREQIDTLTLIRDSLLPRLMSGKGST